MGAGKTEAIRSLSDVPVYLLKLLIPINKATIKWKPRLSIMVVTRIALKSGYTVLQDKSRFDFIWSVICKGAIGAIIFKSTIRLKNPIEELENYLDTFQNHTDNIAIGITHTDVDNTKSTLIYKDWLISQDLYSPLFLSMLEKEDVLLLLGINHLCRS